MTPNHLAGAIDAEAGEKAARFMRLCETFGLPIVTFCDTPGFMVGPEAERSATVRKVTRMFVAAASLSVPVMTVIVRKAYGLGAMAMAAGGMHAPFFTVAWPTGELGAMGLESAAMLAYRKELDAMSSEAERARAIERWAEVLRENGKALEVATQVEIDDVIDPERTRSWIVRGLSAARRSPLVSSPYLDTW